MYFGFRHYMMYYLPPPRQCPVEFLRDVLGGKKKLLKTAQLKSIKVPPLEDLSVEKVYAQVKADPELRMYFPDYGPKTLPDRQYLFDVVATLRHEDLKAQVLAGMRKKKRSEPGDSSIAITEEMRQELDNIPDSIGSSRGRAV